MFLSLLTTLVVLGQAPATIPSASPLTVLIAPPDAAGVPSHIVSFAQEHVYEQLKTEGLQVIRASELSQGLPPAQRKAVLGCNRLEAACRITLGEAAVADVVMIAELVQFLSGYRVGLKAYATRDGELLAEYYVPGVHEDQLLDAFTEASNKVLPPVLRALRPSQEPVAQTPAVTPTPVPGATGPLTPGVATVRQGTPEWAWMPAAGGAVMLGLGTFFTIQAGNNHYRLTNTKFDNAMDARSERDAGIRNQALGTTAFVLGAAGVATTGALYLLKGKSPLDYLPVRPTASVGPSGGSVGLVGTLP
ncbi:hypothetical protein [Cystobacter ferrugineus]|uniref:Uncharacterized protein n=1 Tax=Cystobacter ferrugineus TaxID=83449 RepID=A0A1L9B1J7_9BACT|nr:hypothetical protein [Cystobacter ferrugineus]OJH36135.1 hypothetical protein BON30_33750 [Cystobacter ferrugineus]